MKLFFKLALGIILGLVSTVSVFAQNEEMKPVARKLEAIASIASTEVRVGEEVSFSADKSINPFPEKPAVYSWSFGDEFFSSLAETTHAYTKPGVYEVRLIMQVGNENDSISFQIFVYEKAILLLYADSQNEAKVQTLSQALVEKNIFLDSTALSANQQGFLGEESVVANSLQSRLSTVQEAQNIILWTEGKDAISGFAKFARELNPPMDFSDKRIIVLSEKNLDTLAKIARGAFATTKPQEIFLTRAEALREILFSADIDELNSALENQGIAFRRINSGLEEFSIIAPLSFFVNYLVSQGISASVILLVLLLPVIATLVAFMKQVIGITTFGVYTPSVLTLSFLAIGLKLGFGILLVVVFASVATRKILKHWRLAYTPRLAIILSAVALAILFAIAFLAWVNPLGENSNIASLIAASIFPMLIMSTLAEKFVSIQSEKGSRSALQMFGELLLVSGVCYFVVGEWKYFQTLLLSTPEILLLFLLFDVLLGRFTGLRFTEYFRFHEVIKKSEEEE